MTAQLLTDLLEAIAITDLSEAPELQRAWDMLNDADKRWPKEIAAEVERLHSLLGVRTLNR